MTGGRRSYIWGSGRKNATRASHTSQNCIHVPTTGAALDTECEAGYGGCSPPYRPTLALACKLPCRLVNAVAREDVMNAKKDIMPEYPEYFEPEYPGRPLEYVKDRDGNGWLCDKGVDRNKDLREQGCWRCDDVTFPYGGR